MDPWITALIGAGASIAVAIVGLLVARAKGLPAINAEIEARQTVLKQALEGQLTSLRAEFDTCRTSLTEMKRVNRELREENRELRRDLRSTEWELLSLYRATSTPVPQRLADRAEERDE